MSYMIIGVVSMLAGLCSIDGYAHLGHNIADSLNANFDLAHGHACALALPAVIEAVAPYSIDSTKRIGIAQGLNFTGKESPQEIGAMVGDKYRELFRYCNLPSLKSLGITREQVLSETVINNCFLTELCIQMFPAEKVTREDMVWCLSKIYDAYQ
ncbi:MAG: iron-containing alcohol dehydrogenase [Clostridiaceae bacterium]|nr:iron-containing alcohol dehydrogenase [Clostridiaceae bacterium]